MTTLTQPEQNQVLQRAGQIITQTMQQYATDPQVAKASTEGKAAIYARLVSNASKQAQNEMVESIYQSERTAGVSPATTASRLQPAAVARRPFQIQPRVPLSPNNTPSFTAPSAR